MARRGAAPTPPPPRHAAVPSLEASQELEAAQRELKAIRKVQAEVLSGVREPGASLPPWPVTETSGTATYLARNSKGGPVDWTEGPAHLSTLLRQEIAREQELMAIDAAKHRNATTLLRSAQETYAQGMRDVERCARCRKYGAGVNRTLQGAMRRTLEGLRGYAPPATGEGKG